MHSLTGMRWVSYPWGVLTLSRSSLGHTDPSGEAPWALIPLFLSRVGLAPPLALSLAWASRPLFLLLSRGPCAPSLSLSLARAGLAPPFSRGLCSHIRALHSWCRTTFSWAALSLVTPPACPKSLLCLSDLSFVINLCDGS